MEISHIPDSQLERYVTGMIHDEAEIRYIEDHFFSCPECTERMWAFQEGGDDSDSGSAETGEPDLYRPGGPLQ